MSASSTVTSALPQAASRIGVLVPALVEGAFDYLLPEGIAEGALVEVPLAGRKLIGAVWDVAPPANAVPVSKLKSVVRVIDTVPPLSKPFRQWLDWIADFTLAPKGAVLSLCGLAHAAKLPKKPLVVSPMNIQLPTLLHAQQTVADALITNISVIASDSEAIDLSPTKKDGLPRYARNDEIIKPTLLDGVTGSGKTEVYFHAIAAAMEGDGQVLVLVPEIALTHQLLARFEKTFGAAPNVWHSRMTPAVKAKTWQAVARGEVKVIVGARSALFLPFANLKLIVVDEEHDPSYKQEDGVLYHARDMAIVRAHFEQIPILLVSATPSLETLENVREGKYRSLHLPERFGVAGLPHVSLVDMRNDPPERGDFLSPSVKQGILATLARGEQVLLFLNRRGYAPLLLCRACGHRFQCADCTAWLVVHGTSRLECHHCGHKEKMPPACPKCNADKEKLAPCGPGVERIAEEVKALVAGDKWQVTGEENTPVTRHPSLVTLSSDEAIAAGTWEAIERGEIDIIVGTQMVAKGHHFPRLTFVAVVDADVGLSGADLRAGERTYQLLHQLSGRAGRAEKQGTVLIQTYEPNHPVMQSLAAQDRNRLMALEAKERKAGGWPPFGQLAAILLDGVDEAKVKAAGQALAKSAPVDGRLSVLGPAPAPLSKLRGQYRYRLLVKAKPGIHLQRTLRNWLTGQKFSGVRIKVDVNPYYFM